MRCGVSFSSSVTCFASWAALVAASPSISDDDGVESVNVVSHKPEGTGASVKDGRTEIDVTGGI